MKQTEVADCFDQIADLLELKGENRFRIQAYRRAALNLRNLTQDIEEISSGHHLTEIPGIGKELAAKIEEILATGRLNFLEKLKRQIPEGLSMLVDLPGVGPKTAQLIYQRFKVKSLDQLKSVVQAGRLRSLPGLRQKKEENILRGIELLQAGRQRMPLGVALSLGRQIVRDLEGLSEVNRIALAGSLRRRKETVRDIDLLITSTHPAAVMDRFVKFKWVDRVQAHGQTKSSVRTREGVQVDLRVVEPESFGAALVYFTGSKAHNIKIRTMAQRKGLTLNEYGVFREKTKRRIAGKEEEEVYRALGLAWIPPELREDGGEIEASYRGKLPHLVEIKDLKGAFHNHSNWSDGHHSIEELAQGLRARGYRYMQMSDHSKSLHVAHGLSEARLLEQMEEVSRLNRRLSGFRILMGAEVDILPDGKMDYPDRLLSKLDLVIAAVHSAFKQPQALMTRRIIRALENRYVNILAHPTGRLLGEREPYSADWNQIFSAARKTGTALEINCYTQRLDLNDALARQAREGQVKLAISLDTHFLGQLEDLELGLSLARRAWASKSDILNTMELKELLFWVGQKRKAA